MTSTRRHIRRRKMVDMGTRPWISRASTSKVRSGCITCKNRHVKCDEAKPTCTKCQKIGRVCGGYRKPLSAKPNKTSSTKVYNLSSNLQVAPLLSNPAITLFDTETEHLYFDFFLHHTSHKLSHNIAAVIWTSIVPQACVQDCPIRHAVIAIAALDKTADSAVKDCEVRPMVDCSSFRQSVAVKHYNIAVKQYDKALTAMGSDLTAEGDHNIRKILIFCLLTICFERYIGNQEAGNSQVLIGNNLLSSWLQKARSARPFLVESSIWSPSPDILEDDLIHAFIRLRQRAGTAYAKAIPWRIMNEEDEAIKCMPQEFSTLRDAKIFWELIERRIECSRMTQDMTYPVANGDSCYIFRPLIQMDTSGSSIEGHISAVSMWTDAFEGVFARSRTSTGNVDYLGATVVKMRSLISRPLCIVLSCETEMGYDAFYQDYIEIITLAKSVLRHSYPAHFRFEIGMVPTLFHLVILCRHQALRREALAILEAYSCREGTWDSLMAVSIGRWVTETEEAGRQENFWIAADARLRIYSFSYSLRLRQAILVYQMWQEGKYWANSSKQVKLTW